MKQTIVSLVLALLVVTLGLAATYADGSPSVQLVQTGAASAHRVDLNSAGSEELQSLPGVGPALAARIVAFRQENGPFRTVDDLLAVKGIGPKMLEKLRDKVTANPPASGRS